MIYHLSRKIEELLGCTPTENAEKYTIASAFQRRLESYSPCQNYILVFLSPHIDYLELIMVSTRSRVGAFQGQLKAHLLVTSLLLDTYIPYFFLVVFIYLFPI